MADGHGIDQAFADGALVDRALARTAAAARRAYVRLGRPMPVWQGGRVVRIPSNAARGGADGRLVVSGAPIDGRVSRPGPRRPGSSPCRRSPR
jgi:hypothetical protein